MKKVRIVKHTYVDGNVNYIIQQKHFLFRWMWVPASVNSVDYVYCNDEFDTLEEAKEHLCYFDGSSGKSEVVYEG